MSEITTNKIDQNPNYKEIYQFVHELFTNSKHFATGPFDETYFTPKVFETTKEIIAILQEDNPNHTPSIKIPELLVACILHDIGKTDLDYSIVFNKKLSEEIRKTEWMKHSALSVPIARKFLIQQGHSEEFIKEVCSLIAAHDKRGDLMKNRSIELKILQDADILADCGITGFIRSFLHATKNEKPTIQAISYLQKNSRLEEQMHLINLKVSKLMAEELLKEEKELTNKASKIFDSELFD